MMKREAQAVVVVSITFGWAVIEWLLLELRRAPYRPPHDMKTFLGAERDSVVLLMEVLAATWIIYLIICCGNPIFRWTDYAWFAMFVALLAVAMGYVVMFPFWPVTPPELLWS